MLSSTGHYWYCLQGFNSALALPPKDSKELHSILSAVDSESTGFVTYPDFLSAAALKLRSRDELDDTAEVDEAYRLFTRGNDGPITLSHLRSISRQLKEDHNVDDQLLRNMILEANGGAGVDAGVTRDEFRDVLKRAGMF